MTEHPTRGGARPAYPLVARLLALPAGCAIGWCLWYALFRLIPPGSHWQLTGDSVRLVGNFSAALPEAVLFVVMPITGAVEAWKRTARREPTASPYDE
jgi:hypothetical protein